MSVDAISFVDVPDQINREDHQEIQTLAQKIQLIWSKIYDTTNNVCSVVVQVARSGVGSVVRDAFFFPLKWSLIANRQSVRNQLQIEEKYCRDFWNPLKPLDPNFKSQANIREKFAPPLDRSFSIELKDGKNVEITCRIIETKAKEGKFYNFVQVPGIYTTINNDIAATYPYLAAYLNAGDSLPPARFIMVSENNLNFKPANLDEAGYVLLETLKTLRAEFGDIDHLVAHSLGNIFLTNALKQVDDLQVLPKHICFDRAPISIWEASKKYFWGLGRLIYFMAAFGGWASDIEQDVVNFCRKWKKRPSLMVTGVIQDHRFSGTANLCLGEKIGKIKGIDVLIFDPPRQVVHEYAHHNLRPDFLNPCYLTEDSDLMESSKNLPEAIIHQSLIKDEKVLLSEIRERQWREGWLERQPS